MHEVHSNCFFHKNVEAIILEGQAQNASQKITEVQGRDQDGNVCTGTWSVGWRMGMARGCQRVTSSRSRSLHAYTLRLRGTCSSSQPGHRSEHPYYGCRQRAALRELTRCHSGRN